MPNWGHFRSHLTMAFRKKTRAVRTAANLTRSIGIGPDERLPASRFTGSRSHLVRKDVHDDNRQYDSGNQCCRGNEKGSQGGTDYGYPLRRCEWHNNVAVPVAY